MKMKNTVTLFLILTDLLVTSPIALAAPSPKTINLTGALAEDLYKSLREIRPEGEAQTKIALLSTIEEYDGPGPFSYLVTYSSKENSNQVYKVDSLGDSETSEAEAIYKKLLNNGNGLPYHSNTPTDTQTIVDAVVTCSIDGVQHNVYRCVAAQTP